MKKLELFFAFILLPLDIVMILLSFGLAYILRDHLEIGSVAFAANASDYISLTIYFIPLLIVIYALNGLYTSRLNKGIALEFYKIFESNSAAFAILILVLFFSKTDVFSRLILLFTWILGILFVYLTRLLVRIVQRILLKKGIGYRNVLVLGANHAAALIANEIRKSPWSGYKFIGALGSTDSNDIKILGDIKDYERVIHDFKVDDVIANESKLSSSELASIINYCADHHIGFKFVTDIASRLSLRMINSTIGSMPVLEVQVTALDGWGRIVKRISDIVLSVLALIVASPILLIISLLIKLTSKGPIIYSHDRIGRDGKPFRLHKFRSMYLNAENKQNKYWTEANDDRITPLGKFIRKTNLDELPQLWDILVGKMSFVGPRPEQPRWVEKFSAEVPDYTKRHRIKCGLTGWAQVNGLKGDTSISERVRYDLFYIENWSMWFDIKIIFRTAALIIYEVFKGKYEYRAGS